jgi:TonB-linked SusC/RagA family outer membrane protein
MKKTFDLWVYSHPTLKKLIMELKIAFFIIVISVSNVFATPTYSQVAKVSLNMENKSLEQVMDKIESQSEFYFIFNQKQINVNRIVNIQEENMLITDILPELFKGTNVNYAILDRKILLTTDPIENKLLAVASGTEPQQNRITGTVTDKNGPIPGANVVVTGTTQGTLTDIAGKYSIDVPPTGKSLTFSFVGMVPQEIAIGTLTQINVTMVESTIGLDEIVVIGFGTQKKVNLTGAVTTVKAETLHSVPVSNAVQALQGIVPGLYITQSGTSGGQLDNSPSINIRGITTIGAGSSGKALVLIDGLEGDLSLINREDIENISVLKDAASSSIYGSRAPFGVILVTTKKGKAGKCNITFNYDNRWNSPILLPKMTNSFQYATTINDACFNAGQTAYFTDSHIKRIQDYMAGKITTVNIVNPISPQYWQEMYYEGNGNYDIYKSVYKNSAPSQEYSLNINGGNDNVTYYVSGNYLQQDGLLKLTSDAKNNYGPEAGTDNIKRYNFTAKIDFKLAKWASLAYIGKFNRQDYNRPSDMSSLTQNFARSAWPMLSLYDDNGFYWNAPNYAVDLVLGGRARTQADNITQQLQLTLEPLKGWKVYAEIMYRTADQFYHMDHQLEYNHDVAGNPFLWTSNSRVHEDASRTNYFSPNIYTEYSRSMGDHNFKVMVGFQSELNQYRFFSAERRGIIITSLPSIDITSGTDVNGIAVPPTVGGNYMQWATAGVFGRIDYDYKGRYLFEGNMRYDGTSRFKSNQRWNVFPSASVGWIVSREDFWKNLLTYVSNFKIRGSYGELGNQNTSSLYPTYASQPFGTANGTWLVAGAKTNTASAPSLISSSLTWERIKTWDIGTDIDFFKNRLNSTFDYYVRYTNNMIGPAPELPVILGTSVPTTNNTDLVTSGWELSLGWKDRFSNGIGYGINFSIADSRTRITRYPNPTNALSTYISDQLTGNIWGYTTIGIAKTQAEMDTYLASLPNGGQDAIGSNWKAGDIMYADLNGDGKINAGSSTLYDHGDLSVIGNTTPRYSVGLDLKVDWKGFDIRGFIQGILKRDYSVSSSDYYFWGPVDIWDSTVLTEHLDYFRDDPNHPLGLNLNSYYPRPVFNSAKNKQIQTRYLLNAAYARLKNLQVGYTLPSSITKKVAIQNLRVYVSAENLLTITKMAKMFDPETVDGGWGGNIYPLCKVQSIGVSITF